MTHRLAFQKFHGNGNDFVFLPSTALTLPALRTSWAQTIAALCDRHRGIGADGVVFFDPQSHGLHIANADGSLAGTCGNALRCYGLKCLREGLWDGATPLAITHYPDTHAPLATLLEASQNHNQVVLSLGPTQDLSILTLPPGLPIPGFRRTPNSPPPLRCAFVRLANPHLVFWDPLFEGFSPTDYEAFGRWAQNQLPESLTTPTGPLPCCNVGMLHGLPQPQTAFNLVVYERGAGLTQCCGSGASAAHVALKAWGVLADTQDSCVFRMPGGPVRTFDQHPVWQQPNVIVGPAAFVYEGSLSPDDFLFEGLSWI